MVINAIGSNLDGFLKFVGSTDADNIGTSQSGTASTALTLNGASVTQPFQMVGKRTNFEWFGKLYHGWFTIRFSFIWIKFISDIFKFK